jgi:hypothetical protein
MSERLAHSQADQFPAGTVVVELPAPAESPAKPGPASQITAAQATQGTHRPLLRPVAPATCDPPLPQDADRTDPAPCICQSLKLPQKSATQARRANAPSPGLHTIQRSRVGANARCLTAGSEILPLMPVRCQDRLKSLLLISRQRDLSGCRRPSGPSVVLRPTSYCGRTKT